ncbi:MAG: hypothetical protein LBB23_00840 [Rickettsiales bacterium]|jgi:hypothetical protein|nr:hypothetical protein [Rickettsiales bacterium]
MIKDLQNYKIGDLSNIDKLPDEVQFRIYKSLNLKYRNSPIFGGQSFQKISDDEYKIFGLTYAPSQILIISADGQETLDGNNSYYWKPNCKFDTIDYGTCYKTVNDYIKDRFCAWVDLGKACRVNIGQVAIVPVKFYNNHFANIVGHVVPEYYDFNKGEIDLKCSALCIPFEGRDKPLNSGIFADYWHSVPEFAKCAARDAIYSADNLSNFQNAVRMACCPPLGMVL